MSVELRDFSGALPAVRAVDVTPARVDAGELCFVLRDRLGIAPRPLIISLPAYFVLVHLNGEHTYGQVAVRFREQFGQPLAPDEFEHLLRTLDESLLLQNGRFEAALAAARAAYTAAPVRDNRDRWPDAAALRAEIEIMLSRGEAVATGRLAGLVAPHLDYGRGSPCYAATYAALAPQPRARRYVILGTNHFGLGPDTVATRKAFQTPLGCAATDAAFVDELSARAGVDLCEHEFDHAAEHSIELQVHLLQALRPDGEYSIVPLLCPDPSGMREDADAARLAALRRVADALGALVEATGEATVVIASADLSHVGQSFGDDEPTTEQRLGAIAASDRALLEMFENRRGEDVVAHVRAAANPTRICSVGCLYVLARALRRPLRWLRYHQAASIETETTVTCAAGLVER
jgi:hypothetical protein